MGNMKMLVAEIHTKGLTIADLAQIVNIETVKLENKIIGMDFFTIGEMSRLAEKLGLRGEKAKSIFLG